MGSVVVSVVVSFVVYFALSYLFSPDMAVGRILLQAAVFTVVFHALMALIGRRRVSK